MNILLLSDAFWPDHTGGITKSLWLEVERLARRGHRIVVLTRRLRSSLPLYEPRNGYELYRYPGPDYGTPFYLSYPLFSVREVPKIVEQLHKEVRFDVAYVHNVFQAVGLRRCSFRIPFVYVFHAPTPCEVEIEATRGKYGLATPLVRLAIPWIKAREMEILSFAKTVLVRSKSMEWEMQRLYGEAASGRIARIPLGVDTERFAYLEDPRSVRRELGLPTDCFVLLTVRRLVARMGLENLIVAMTHIIKQFPDVLLYIGGKGYLGGALRAQIRALGLESNVKLLGFIDENKLPRYYQAADLFILPTLALEGFGLVTIEALSCGTPVIATPVGANPEVISPLGEEFLCSNTTPEAIAERVIWFLQRGVNVETRKRCRRYCESNFSIDVVVSALENLLFESLS